MSRRAAESWIQVRATIPRRLQRPFADALSAQGLDALLIETSETLGGTDLDAESARVVAFLPGKEAARSDEIRQMLMELATRHDVPTRLEIEPYTDTSWRDGWKRFFVPRQVSPRLAVRAPWAELEVGPNVESLVIEPGAAFGTGLHETTRLCLEVVDRVTALDAPRAMLDVGCGSGVLCIAAARLGLARAIGIDVDIAAVEASRQNANVNDVADACAFSTTPVDAIDERAPLVVANILSHILLAIRAPLVERVADGGRLVLSGLLAVEMAAIEEAFVTATSHNLEVERRHTLGEWACIELVAQ